MPRRFENHDATARDDGGVKDRGVNVDRQALDEGPGEKRSRQRHDADQERKAEPTNTP